jgi:hypothetical protein
MNDFSGVQPHSKGPIYPFVLMVGELAGCAHGSKGYVWVMDGGEACYGCCYQIGKLGSMAAAVERAEAYAAMKIRNNDRAFWAVRMARPEAA